MFRTTAWLVIAALLSGLFAVTPAGGQPLARQLQAQAGSEAALYAPGGVWVGLNAQPTARAMAALQTSLHARTIAALPQVNAVLLETPPGKELETARLARQQPGVAFAEVDYAVATIDEMGSTPPAPGDLAAPVKMAAPAAPNDPDYPLQWALPKIEAPTAWSYTTGSPDLLIAVVDSGVQLAHPELAAKIWTNPGEIPANGLDDDGNGKVDDIHGWHFFHTYTGSAYMPAEDANANDDFGHGTHVAGVIAAVTNNQAGIAGLAWGGRILPVKVLDQYGSGWYSDIAAGILYAADNGARIINLSLGGADPSELLRSAVEYAHSRGALVVAAAGNSGGGVYYPAAYDPAMAVAASDQNDQRPSFSNYGAAIDLAAPGTEIYSTWYRGNYFTKSGTSMAAPHVSGVAALLWSLRPALTPSQVADLLRDSAVDIGAPGWDIYTGFGRLSASRAVGLLEGYPDLWIKSLAPPVVQAGRLAAFTIHYGNRGEAVAPASWITSTVVFSDGSLQRLGWPVPALPAASATFTVTVNALAGPATSVLTDTVVISSPYLEANPLDNQDQVEAVSSSSDLYLPLINRR